MLSLLETWSLSFRWGTPWWQAPPSFSMQASNRKENYTTFHMVCSGVFCAHFTITLKSVSHGNSELLYRSICFPNNSALFGGKIHTKSTFICIYMCIYTLICRSNVSSWEWHESKHYTKLHFTISSTEAHYLWIFQKLTGLLRSHHSSNNPAELCF